MKKSPRISQGRRAEVPGSEGRKAQRRKPGRQPAAEAGASTVEVFRRRMHAIGETLAELCGGMASPEADLWGRGVYLMLVDKLYTALNSPGLPLADLQAISKILSEQRRAESQALEIERRRQTGRPDESLGDRDEAGTAPPPGRELPVRFGEAVKQIYGVNLHAKSVG